MLITLRCALHRCSSRDTASSHLSLKNLHSDALGYRNCPKSIRWYFNAHNDPLKGCHNQLKESIKEFVLERSSHAPGVSVDQCYSGALLACFQRKWWQSNEPTTWCCKEQARCHAHLCARIAAGCSSAALDDTSWSMYHSCGTFQWEVAEAQRSPPVDITSPQE